MSLTAPASLRPFRGMTGGVAPKEETTHTTFGFASQSPQIVDPYVPRNSSELWGNSLNFTLITKWIRDKLERKETYPYILLVGGVGVGKSEFLRICFRECGCSVIEYDDELRNSTYEVLKDSINMSNIEMLFFQSTRKIGTIVDNYQTTLIPAHRKEFITFLRNNITSPLIFTSDTMANTTDLQRGKGLVLQYELPTVGQMVGLGRRLCPEMGEGEVRGLAEMVHPDVRSFRNMLSCGVSRFKDLNMDIRDNIAYFYDNDFRDCMRQTSLFTSHIVQENYLDMCPKNMDMQKVWEIAEYCSIGDLIKESAFENQAWDYMNDLGNAMGTMGPMSILREVGGRVVAKVPNRKIVILPGYISEVRLSLLDVYYVMMKLVGNVKTIEDNLEFFFGFIGGIEFEVALKILHLGYSFNNVPYKDIKRITSKLKKYHEVHFSEEG